MAQQQIITKPYVEKLQDNDSLFINHDGALRQIKKSDADFASGTDMRAEVAAREAFEAQEVAAREAFEKSETEARKQFETSVGGQIAEKANVDGYYEEMTVGDAEQLVATQFVEDNEPYLFRSTGGSSDVGNRAYFDKIVGGTVAWNQLADIDTNNFSNLNVSSSVTSGEIKVLSTSDNTAFKGRVINLTTSHVYLGGCAAKSDGASEVGCGFRSENGVNITIGVSTLWSVPATYERQLRMAKATADTDMFGIMLRNDTPSGNYGLFKDIQVIDLTQMFGSTIADYIYSLEQATAGAGVAWFKKLFPNDYYAYNAGELLSVEGLQSHDTVGFNQWDEEWRAGYYDSSTGEFHSYSTQLANANPIKVLPNTTYHITPVRTMGGARIVYRDSSQNLISIEMLSSSGAGNFTTPSNCKYVDFCTMSAYGGTYHDDICINLSDPTRNGEYEPYEKHSYPLDSSLTLRGIPKLDASNNLYYDGDEYTSDGKVKRKYGIVDLGTLSWARLTDGNYPRFASTISRINRYSTNIILICTKYTPISGKQDYTFRTTNYDKCITNITDQGDGYSIAVQDSSYTDASTFKASLSGVYLIYELATPTTETAEPYQFTQIIDDFGTEEFVSNGFIPAGHMTRYPANLRDKLQHLPDLAGMDGTYLIQQSGKQMSLVYMPAIFPETPTEDGTYTLKTVVTGGVATLQWVVE